MDGPIASAVIVPEDLAIPASPPRSHKRRQSSVSEDNTKRPRLAGNEALNNRRETANGAKPGAPGRRDRGAALRLFGAALGALSQNPTTAAQKRRSEIEKRQQAQRRQEEEESEQRKAERRAKRKAQRWKEQNYFEKRAMRTRHANLLNMAHFLQTRSEPHLYYKPWETTPEEEDRIRDQIVDARDTIDREVTEYETRQQEEAQRERHAPDEASHDAECSHTGKIHNADAPQDPITTNGGTNGSAKSPRDLEMTDDLADHPGTEAVRDAFAIEDAQDNKTASREPTADESNKDSHDESEEVIEEAAEDTVIY